MVGEGFDPFSAEPQPRTPIKNRWEAEVAQQIAVQDVAGDPTGSNMDQDLVSGLPTYDWGIIGIYNYNWPWAMGSTMVSSHLGFLGCTSKSWGSTREHYPKLQLFAAFNPANQTRIPRDSDTFEMAWDQ